MARQRRGPVGRIAGRAALATAVALAATWVPVAHSIATWSGVGGATASSTAARVDVPPAWPSDLPGCWPEGDSAVADKTAQRFWLCTDGVPVTAALPMTTASFGYGLPPVGVHRVTTQRRLSGGIGGSILHDFTIFFVTPRGNNIGFHRYVDQDPGTLGDLDQRGASSGCFRVHAEHADIIFEFLDVGDRVVVLTP